LACPLFSEQALLPYSRVEKFVDNFRCLFPVVAPLTGSKEKLSREGEIQDARKGRD